jgi:hypothetical protein
MYLNVVCFTFSVHLIKPKMYYALLILPYESKHIQLLRNYSHLLYTAIASFRKLERTAPKMFCYFQILLLCLVCAFASCNADTTYRKNGFVAGRNMRGSLGPTFPVHVQIAIAQNNADLAAESLLKISDPTSPEIWTALVCTKSCHSFCSLKAKLKDCDRLAEQRGYSACSAVTIARQRALLDSFNFGRSRANLQCYLFLW